MDENFVVHYKEPSADSETTFLLLHGTGGNERDLIPLAQHLNPAAACICPRGQVSEGGALRYFRRFAEGVLDLDDWRACSLALAAFVNRQCQERKRHPEQLFAMGYSNGANAAQGLLLLAPQTVAGAVLIRPMFVTQPEPMLPLVGKRILLLCGRHDPLMQPNDPERLLQQYRERGADVRLELLEAGHQLTRDDMQCMDEWFNSL